jgi:hypothetical protein
MADTPHLVERRRRYIQRQIEIGAPSVNVRFQHARPEGTGPPNRHGMPQLPVGQHAVKNWPVLDLGEQPDVPLDAWRLEVGGLVENPITLTWAQFWRFDPGRQRLPLRHDPEPLRQSLGRRALQTIAGLVVPQETAKFVLCTGYDHESGTGLPTRPTCRSHAPSKPMCCWCTPEKDGRCRLGTGTVPMITPKLYAWKGTKWIRQIEFLSSDHRGSGNSWLLKQRSIGTAIDIPPVRGGDVFTTFSSDSSSKTSRSPWRALLKWRILA